MLINGLLFIKDDLLERFPVAEEPGVKQTEDINKQNKQTNSTITLVLV